jgi:hypothetical protein
MRLEESRTRLEFVDASLTLSYDLLDPELQEGWRALAVFPETFDVEAAAAVWEVEPDEARDTLGGLLRYSMVEWDEASGRYRLHGLARLFASSRLSEVERTAARRRHAEHYREVLALAGDLYLEGVDDLMRGLTLFDLEWPNIQARPGRPGPRLTPKKTMRQRGCVAVTRARECMCSTCASTRANKSSGWRPRWPLHDA